MRARTIALAFAAGALTLTAGFAVKNLCTTHPWDGFQYRSTCYNDIYSLYSFRGLEYEPIPYINGSGVLDDQIDAGGQPVERGDLEYPAGTGLLVALVALVVANGLAFFYLTAVALAALAAAALAALARITADPRRLFLFALAPSLGLYAFHNWDLLAVASLCASLVLFARGRDGWAGAAIGFGAAAKVFPGVVLPALLIARYRQRRAIAWPMIAAAAGVFAAVNLPFLLANLKGWWLPWQFQSSRFPNFETHWYMLYRHLGNADADGFWWQIYPRLTSVLSLALFAAGAFVFLRAEVRRERFRPYAAAFGLVLLFLLTGKIYSPQFALWVLPFFVLVRVPVRTYLAFVISDLVEVFAIYAFLLRPEASGTIVVLEVAVWARYAVLAWILASISRADDTIEAVSMETVPAT